MTAFIEYGRFFGNALGQTDHDSLILLPDNDGNPVNDIHWGYGGQEPPRDPEGAPLPVWKLTPDLRQPPYNVPVNATAVKLGLKVKAKTVSWPGVQSLDSFADMQVMIKANTQASSPNECCHVYAGHTAGGVTGLEINSPVIDVPLGEDGKIAVFLWPSIKNDGFIRFGMYLAGYWLPLGGPVFADA